jgi:hypothetical protein
LCRYYYLCTALNILEELSGGAVYAACSVVVHDGVVNSCEGLLWPSLHASSRKHAQ